MKPNPCGVLAIDPGLSSGVAWMRQGRLLYHATVDTTNPMLVNSIVTRALLYSINVRETLVLVGETWGASGGFRGLHAIQGLGAAWKSWEWSLDRAWKTEKENLHVTQPAPKKHRVHTATWRSKLFGRRLRKDEAKHMALAYANQRFQIHLDFDDHNAAEAVCIGVWATYANEILEKIPRRFR